MSTGIILGLGLSTIVLTFYIVLNFQSWLIDYKIRKNKKMAQPKKYHDWVYMADDSINKVLKTVIVLLYCYGFYVIIRELMEKII
mgnify:CR=1 FL=1